MRVKIYPSKAEGFVKSNISKSYAHRALICAALAQGVSHIRFSGSNQDIDATISVLRKLGAKIDVKEDEVIVEGCKPEKAVSDEVFCNESGSTLRFMIPVFALGTEKFEFTGAGRLMARPQTIYKDFFSQNGLLFQQYKDHIEVQGSLQAGEYEMDGSVSSQFFTGMLFALPLVNGNSVIHVKEPFESKSYVLMTLEVLNDFGVYCKLEGNDIIIPGYQSYKPLDYVVEGDYSSAAFFALLGAINGRIEMSNLKKNSTQGDKAFIEFVERAGAIVEFKDGIYTISPDHLEKITVDLADCPDLGPAAIVLGCISGKGMHLDNIARLRYKESDRIAAMKSEMSKLGFVMEDYENEMDILAERKEVKEEVIVIDSHNDHRIAMSVAIAATVLDKEVIIENAQCVNKSYPNFYRDLANVNVRLEVLDD